MLSKLTFHTSLQWSESPLTQLNKTIVLTVKCARLNSCLLLLGWRPLLCPCLLFLCPLTKLLHLRATNY